MIELRGVNKNIINTETKIIVNPVNCVGVMGNGLAKVIKDNYPKNYEAYNHYCKNKQLTPGGLFVYSEKNRIIYNVATKDDWKQDSQLAWVYNGLALIKTHLKEDFSLSISLPLIGTGKGKMDRNSVYNMTIQHFIDLPNKVVIYV